MSIVKFSCNYIVKMIRLNELKHGRMMLILWWLVQCAPAEIMFAFQIAPTSAHMHTPLTWMSRHSIHLLWLLSAERNTSDARAHRSHSVKSSQCLWLWLMDILFSQVATWTMFFPMWKTHCGVWNTHGYAKWEQTKRKILHVRRARRK